MQLNGNPPSRPSLYAWALFPKFKTGFWHPESVRRLGAASSCHNLCKLCISLLKCMHAACLPACLVEYSSHSGSPHDALHHTSDYWWFVLPIRSIPNCFHTSVTGIGWSSTLAFPKRLLTNITPLAVFSNIIAPSLPPVSLKLCWDKSHKNRHTWQDYLGIDSLQLNLA